jgi:hypothetical protein
MLKTAHFKFRQRRSIFATMRWKNGQLQGGLLVGL